MSDELEEQLTSNLRKITGLPVHLNFGRAPIDSVKYMGIPNGIDQIRRHKLNAAEIKGMSGAQRCPERDIYAADFHVKYCDDALQWLF
jgi:hypothetical protein